jgi:hypothetical protein
MKDSDHDDLRTKLAAWKVEPAVPVTFQRDVWERIAARQTAREDGYGRRLFRSIFAQIARPRYAVALAALSLSASVGLAQVRAREVNAKQMKQLETRYLDSVDPLATSH